MARIDITLTVEGIDTSIDAAVASMASVRAVIESERIANGPARDLNTFAAKHGVSLNDAGDLFVCEPADSTADRTAILERIEVKPSDLFLELVAALAVDANADTAWIAHGWPVLSIKHDDVADGLAESIAALARTYERRA